MGFFLEDQNLKNHVTCVRLSQKQQVELVMCLCSDKVVQIFFGQTHVLFELYIKPCYFTDVEHTLLKLPCHECLVPASTLAGV